MSFVGSLLGSKSGNQGGAGMNYNAGNVNLLQGATPEQAQQSYGNTQQGLTQQQNFISALQAQGGINNQQSIFNQQQQLANQMQGVANGTGPNPAQSALNQATGQNVANQAALMAGQRGAGANAGLMARQIGQQGANIQQQAAGQGATMQAQQQLAAMQALQGQQGMMGNLAGQQVGQQAGALQGYNQAAQGQQGNVLGGLGQFNANQVGMQSNINSANAGIANTVAQGQQGMLGGLLGGAGNAVQTAAPLLMAAAAHGGEFDGKGFGNNQYAGGGLIDYFNAAEGGPVPGQAKIGGDSLQNDVVNAKLSPGEIVIPRSITQNMGAPQKSAEFVAAILAKHHRMRK